jgi:hypothetical protein
MLDQIPDLAIVPIDSLIPHERHDDQRAMPLVDSLRDQGILRNPPVVTPLQDRSRRFMVLDGANRVTALRLMGYPHILVQSVQLDDPNLVLNTWGHVVWGLPSRELVAGLQTLDGVNLQPTSNEQGLEDLQEGRALGLIHLPDEVYAALVPRLRLEARIGLLNSLVGSYLSRFKVDRTNIMDIAALVTLYPRLSGLVRFPAISVDQVAHLAGGGHLLPSGITRFSVSPRVLHVNFPLEHLGNRGSLEKKNLRLRRWVQERLAHKRVRFYREATVLFDD